jgi:hypothetical protein
MQTRHLESVGNPLIITQNFTLDYPRQPAFIAKRLECARLAGAFGVEGCSVS